MGEGYSVILVADPCDTCRGKGGYSAIPVVEKLSPNPEMPKKVDLLSFIEQNGLVITTIVFKGWH